MNTTRRLMLAAAAGAFVVGNATPLIGVLLHQIGWQELWLSWLAINIGYLLPAMLAAALAAIPVARDPDFTRTRVAYLGATLLLLTFVGYFVLMLAWVPAMKAIGVMPARMVDAPSVTLFMSLLFALLAAVPGWAVATLAVSWARRPLQATGAARSTSARPI